MRVRRVENCYEFVAEPFALGTLALETCALEPFYEVARNRPDAAL